MKKLILSGSALVLSMALANAQSPGIGTTYAWDDFAQEEFYVEDADPAVRGVYWSCSTASVSEGTRNATNETSTFVIPSAGVGYLAVNFGGGSTETLDLSGGADIEIGIKTTSSSDVQFQVYLTDANGVILEMEPNISDTKDENGDGLAPGIALDEEVAKWTPSNLVYPLPSNYDPENGNYAVYPHAALNGFVLEAGQDFKKYRIDLSSVSDAKGGRFVHRAPWWVDGDVSAQPGSKLPTETAFDITKVVSVTLKYNGDVLSDAIYLSDNATDTDSYMYDAQAMEQTDWTGTLVINSFKVGSVLPALTGPVTSVKTDAAVNGSLRVGPNPTSGELNVAFESTTDATVSLTDLTGNTVSTKTTGAGQNAVEFNTSGLNKGLYILNVTTENGKAARKVSVQ